MEYFFYLRFETLHRGFYGFALGTKLFYSSIRHRRADNRNETPCKFIQTLRNNMKLLLEFDEVSLRVVNNTRVRSPRTLSH